MYINPFSDKFGGRPRLQVSLDDIPPEIEDRLFTGILRVKVRRIVFIVFITHASYLTPQSPSGPRRGLPCPVRRWPLSSLTSSGNRVAWSGFLVLMSIEVGVVFHGLSRHLTRHPEEGADIYLSKPRSANAVATNLAPRSLIDSVRHFIYPSPGSRPSDRGISGSK